MPLKSVCSCVPQRWIVCALCSLALAIISFKNTCFYALAAIVDAVTIQRPKPTYEGCPFLYSAGTWGDKELPFELPDVYWIKKIISIEDAAFHMGKFLVIIPAGMLSDLGYSKCVLNVGMFLVSLSNIIRPLTLDYGVTFQVVGNFAEGLGEGSLLPAIVSLISRWTPPWERNFFTAVIMAGLFYGNTMGNVLYNMIYAGATSLESGHYITGIIGLIWSGLCFVFIYHAPDESPLVSTKEIRTQFSHRRSSLPATVHKLHGIPWRHIFTSPAFLSLVAAFCSLVWAAHLNMYGNFKAYQLYILRLPERFSFTSFGTKVVILPSLLIGGYFADYICSRNYLTKTVVKRVFTFVGLGFSSVLLLSACFVGCNVTLFWILSVAGCYFLGPAYAVIVSTPVDLSPRYAGLLGGIMIAASTICGMFSGKVTAGLIDDDDLYNPFHWRLRAVVCALVTVLLMIPFLFYGSGEKQYWSRRRPSRAESHQAMELETIDETDLHKTS